MSPSQADFAKLTDDTRAMLREVREEARESRQLGQDVDVAGVLEACRFVEGKLPVRTEAEAQQLAAALQAAFGGLAERPRGDGPV